MTSAFDNAQPARLLRRQNIAPLILVNLGVGLHATIWYMATTAMPSAVEELDAAAYLSWATSLYLMTSILGGAMLPRADRGHTQLAAERLRRLRSGGFQRVQHAEGATVFHDRDTSTAPKIWKVFAFQITAR